MPKIAIPRFLIRPEIINLYIFKNHLNTNNGNVYSSDGMIFGMNIDMGQIQFKAQNLYKYLMLQVVIEEISNYSRSMIFLRITC